jgi:hypothetical protein
MAHCLLLLLQLRSLRNVIDCERSGLARYFSTGSGSFAVKENGTFFFLAFHSPFCFDDYFSSDHYASVIDFGVELEMPV